MNSPSLLNGDDCVVIAEAGVNHGGSLAVAVQMVVAAAEAGADAVKFQTFRAEEVATRHARKARYQAENTGDCGSQVELLRDLELGEDAFRELQACTRGLGIEFLSTPFGRAAVDLLVRLGVRALKIGSGELTNYPLLGHVAQQQLPVILSTGMARLGEIEAALDVLRSAGDPPVVLLHCVSEYPARPEDMNLRAMETLRASFGLPVGLSDHTLGIEVSLAAVALGACVIEKHFTLDRDASGPDHRASLDPSQLAAMVAGIRKVEAALGDGRKVPTEAEQETKAVVRRSVVAARDLDKGTVLAEDMLCLRRPGTGLQPHVLPRLHGRRLRRSLAEGDLLDWDDLA